MQNDADVLTLDLCEHGKKKKKDPPSNIHICTYYVNGKSFCLVRSHVVDTSSLIHSDTLTSLILAACIGQVQLAPRRAFLRALLAFWKASPFGFELVL